MLLIIIVTILLLTGIGLIIWDNRSQYGHDEAATIGFILTLVFGIGFIIMILCAMTIKQDFQYYEDQYNNLKEQVEYVDSDDIITGENLRNQVLEMNNDISKHKRYSQNVWIGMYFSERLGNLEPIRYQPKRDK